LGARDGAAGPLAPPEPGRSTFDLDADELANWIGYVDELVEMRAEKLDELAHEDVEDDPRSCANNGCFDHEDPA